jgi:hypothetical protein
MLCKFTGQTIFPLLEVVVYATYSVQAINPSCTYKVRPYLLVFGFLLVFLLFLFVYS